MRIADERQRFVAGAAVLLGGIILGTVVFEAAYAAAGPPSEKAQAPTAGKPAHTIKRGDTLWDIAGARLGQPVRWPEIWKSNAFIKNPNVIYPGQILELDPLTSKAPPAAGEVPAEPAVEPAHEAEVGGAGEAEEEVGTREPAQARPLTEIAAVSEPAPQPAPREAVATPPAPAFMETLRPVLPTVPPTVVATSGAIITDQPTRGTIVSGTLRQLLIGLGDRVFLKPEKGTDLRDGETLMVGRAVRTIRHPKTGARMGQLVQVMGEVGVREHQRGLILGEVTKTFEPLQAGDLLLAMPAAPAPATEETAPAGAQGIQGSIVESKYGNLELGQLDIVYIDKGRRDGVRVDDLYVVLRPGRSRGFFRSATPDTHLGELRIIAVQDATATAEITKSLEPITLGDIIDGPVVSAAMPVPTGP